VTFSTPWLGRKRVAFVPLFRSNAAPPDQIPADWENAILRRVVHDPRAEANGADRSLRAWLRAVSSGLADIDPLVLPMQTIDKQVVEADELEGSLGGQLRDQGADAAVLVMLGGRGAGTNSGFWSRVVMAESNGVWLMELIHGLTGFKDLYHFNNDADPAERDIASFDQMSASSQTHPTAFTKHEFGWLDAGAIAQHAGGSASYELQHLGLAQPPSSGRVAAVRIGAGFPYTMVESRAMTDQFEAGMPRGQGEFGIPSEGVIAYRVQTRNPTVQEREGNRKPLFLMTLDAQQRPYALKPGESAVLDDGMTLTVNAALPGGFAVSIGGLLGEGTFFRSDGVGNISILKQHLDWDQDWDLIVPGNFAGNGHTDLLFYKRSTGEGTFVSTDGRGNISTIRQHLDWDRDWDLIIPGRFGGDDRTDLLFYKRSTGEGLFVSTDGSGNISTIRQHLNWDRDWDLIVPGRFGGDNHTDLLFYKRSTGEGLFVSTDGSGNIPTIRQHLDWDRDWDMIIPGSFGGAGFTDLLFYKRSTGEGTFVGTDGSGNIATIRQHLDWDKDWDLIILGDFASGAHRDLLFYKRSTGEGAFVRTDASGNILGIRQHSGWDKDWKLIVPGNFADSGFTDLLFYKSRR
jgi:hypothetical protein